MDKNKVVVGVFALIAVLVVALIVWSLTLGDGGILQLGWNSMADNINKVWQTITGSAEGVVPKWRAASESNIKDGIDNIDDAGQAGP